jgi:hypothetical protein
MSVRDVISRHIDRSCSPSKIALEVMTGRLAFCDSLAKKKERTKDWTQDAEEERKASNRNLKAQQIREYLLF